MKNEVHVGTVLISKPFMEDKRFEKTIILIVESNNEGTIGFIINKDNMKPVDLMIDNYPKLSINVKNGGPVSKDNLFFIHRHPELIINSQQIKPGIFWGGKLEDVVEKCQSGEILIDDIAFFLGYTGWKKNQLEEEIQEGSWIIHDIELQKIPTQLEWSDLLIDVNKEYEVWAKAPSNFHLN